MTDKYQSKDGKEVWTIFHNEENPNSRITLQTLEKLAQREDFEIKRISTAATKPTLVSRDYFITGYTDIMTLLTLEKPFGYGVNAA